MLSGVKIENKWLVLVAITAIAAFVVACGTDETTLLDKDDAVGAQPTAVVDGSQGAPPPSPPEDLGFEVVEALAPIESVQIMVLESFPEQYVVQVISGLPNGCATFDRADIDRNGTEIDITVYNMVPAPGELIACTEMYGIHDENVGLGSDFDREKRYTVTVNGIASGYF